jgi:ferredoxin
MVDGKAKVTGDFLCDGMGACLDVCSVGALKIVEKDTDDYDAKKTYDHVKDLRGEEAAKNVHGAGELDINNSPASDMQCGCPGSMVRDFTGSSDEVPADKPVGNIKSELRQWPIQLHLLHPGAPYLHGADLVVAADCAPFAYANFHDKFLKGKILTILCPKLDDGQDEYINKLADIFTNQDIKSITIVHMEVPCCGGIESIVRQALEKSGKNIIIKDFTISISGEII